MNDTEDKRYALFVEALGQNKTVKDAAEAVGVSPDALTNYFRRKGETASQHLGSNKHDVIIPEGHELIGNSTLLVDGQPHARWVKTRKIPEEKKKDDSADFWASVAASAERYKGLAEPSPRPFTSDWDLCTMYPLGDPHIGMLAWGRETGEDFDLKIAERDLVRTVDMLVDRAPNSKRAILVNLGDFFHIQNNEQLTPVGKKKLDADSRLGKITEVGFTLIRRMIDRMLTKHELVEVINVPGNHDPDLARMLNIWLKMLYENEPRVIVVDNANPFMYIRHGKCLFGFAHGDGAKMEQLPLIMATDQREDWGQTEFHFWATGHIHHLSKKEYPGCTVESFATLAPTDYHHHHKGYRHRPSLCCVTFDSEYGEITRSTVDLKLARA